MSEPDEDFWAPGEPVQVGPNCPICGKPWAITDEMIERAWTAACRHENVEQKSMGFSHGSMRAALEAALGKHD